MKKGISNFRLQIRLTELHSIFPKSEISREVVYLFAPSVV
jgi:hypothetical protein